MDHKTRRCGASLPDKNPDIGWYWCGLTAGHKDERHHGLGVSWKDGDTVEVVVEVSAVPHHVHDFQGDRDTCVAHPRCQLTWGEQVAQAKAWKRAVEREPRPEADLVNEIVHMGRGAVPYSEATYAAVLEELTESITRRVQRETRQEIEGHG